MYQPPTSVLGLRITAAPAAAGTAAVGSSGVLPFTGLPVYWMIVAVFVLVMAGIALLTLVPRNRVASRKVLPTALR